VEKEEKREMKMESLGKKKMMIMKINKVEKMKVKRRKDLYQVQIVKGKGVNQS